jgi:putative FmdB family regulatory protein
MPIYEYECLQCGKRTELLQRLADAPLAACPQCGGEVKKLISSPAFQFKGSGWYATDYAGKKGGGEPKSETTSESKADDGGKTEKADKADKPKEAAAGAKSGGSGGGDAE